MIKILRVAWPSTEIDFYVYLLEMKKNPLNIILKITMAFYRYKNYSFSSAYHILGQKTFIG